MIKKLLTKIMAVSAGVIAVSSVGFMAFANNYHDTEAQLYLDEASGISEAYTVGRYKEDDSYGYVKHLWSTDERDYAVALVACDNDGETEHYEDFELVYYKVYGKGNEENNNEYYFVPLAIAGATVVLGLLAFVIRKCVQKKKQDKDDENK